MSVAEARSPGAGSGSLKARRARWSRLVLSALVPTVAGCFQYVRADLAMVPNGESVRVRVSPDGMEEVREFSPDAEPIVLGTIVRRDDESLMLHVPLRRAQEGVYDTAIGQDVRIPTSEILQFERRQVDGLRTGVILGGAVAVVTIGVLAIMNSFGGEDSLPILIDDQARVSIFSFFLR
jgi:hypothetical protein